MKFAHQSATIRQHGKGMIILETALETAGLTYVFPDGNGIKNIAFQVKRGEIYAKKEALSIFAQDLFEFYLYFTAPVWCCQEGWGFQR